MKIIDFNLIQKLNISPKNCVKWVEDAFLLKYTSHLPPKISLKMQGDIFINTMPCAIPSIGRFGVKLVSRYPLRNPSLLSDLLLYDLEEGTALAILDGLWITTMRTGAVAALTIQKLEKSYVNNYGFIGLGNTCRATLLCLNAIKENKELNIGLLSYKDQAKNFIERFHLYPNLKFKIYDTSEELIKSSDVIISCVTAANNLFASDNCFNPGVLVVPVHTRGFQNCDLFFDKVFADDTGHVEGFKYFNNFKKFDEFTNVLTGMNLGRELETERILAYNIGIGLHDIYFASKIYDLLESKAKEFTLFSGDIKFWV